MKTIFQLVFFLGISLASMGTALAQQVLPPAAFADSISDSRVLVLDVRSPKEFKQGSLAQAININWNDAKLFKENVEKLDKSRPMYIFCQSGIRSAKAAAYLRKRGFTVFELEGGLQQLHNELKPNPPSTD
jgi:rhodanese-related sulfurtransferase